MVVLSIIIIVLILAIIGVLTYFFLLAFVKQNMGDLDDVESQVNKPLEKYKDVISEGIDYNLSAPHKFVYTVSFDGLKLAARYYDNGFERTVILFHGYRSSAVRDFSCAVKMYKSFGFNVLLCDQRSHGNSEGRLITFGIKESRDVLSWILVATEKLGSKEILLGGMSMGATTVLLSCRFGLPECVKGIVADCGFTSPADIINKVAREFFKINAEKILPLLNLMCRIFGKFSIYETNTLKALDGSNVPVIFIHGDDDNFVPCEMSERAYNHIKERCKMVKVAEAGHGLSYLVDKELVETELQNFIRKSFGY